MIFHDMWKIEVLYTFSRCLLLSHFFCHTESQPTCERAKEQQKQTKVQTCVSQSTSMLDEPYGKEGHVPIPDAKLSDLNTIQYQYMVRSIDCSRQMDFFCISLGLPLSILFVAYPLPCKIKSNEIH